MSAAENLENVQGADAQELTEVKPLNVSFDDDEAEESTPEAEQPEAKAEPSPDDDGEDDLKPQFTPEQQKKFDEVIARKTAKFRAQQRALEAQLAEIQSKVQAPQNVRPEIPPLPDPWDAKFDEKVKERDEILLKAAQYDYENQQREQLRIAQEQQTQQQAQQELQKAVASYSSRALKQGIAPDQLSQAGNLVAQMGVNPHVQLYILGEESGPSVTMYLARNLHEVEKINSMSPVQAAAYIAANVIPNATRAAKAGTPPPQNPRGASPGKIDRGPKGATFE
jgi:hypothetical protein